MRIDVEPHDPNRSIRNFVLEGTFVQIVNSLVTLTVVSSYLAIAGASPLLISFLVSIPFLTTTAQIFSAKFVEKKNRKKISIFTSTTSKLFLLGIALNSFIGGEHEILVFAILYFVFNLCEDVYTVTSNSWARDLIPAGKRGEILSKRATYGRFLATFAIIAQVFIFEKFQKAGFPILFLISALLGIFGVLFLRKVENVKCNLISEAKITEPLRNSSFLILALIAFFLFFSLNSARMFFAVYLLELGYSLSEIFFLAFIAHISSIYFFRFSGSFSDRFGNKPLFSLSALTFAISAVLFAVSGSNSISLLIIAYVIHGFCISAPTIAIANAVADLTYRKHSAPYYALINWISDISSALGCIFAGFLVNSLYYLEENAFRILFLISSAISIFSVAVVSKLYDEFSPPQILAIARAPEIIKDDISVILKPSFKKKFL